MTRWQQFPASRPRAVENGLKARSTRGEIGSSWWSRRFLDVLESFAMGGRLTRGRNYARRGQVISLDIAPGVVTSSVQGSRPAPYAVSVSFAPLTELAWAKIEIALSEQSLPSAKLLAGEVPPSLEQIVTAAGAQLFPGASRDLVQRCSCPDHGVPCKHLAATFYLLAEAFDDDPFLLLAWRGRTREALLTRLRELRSSEAADGPAGGSPAADEEIAPAAGAALALADLTAPPSDPDRFWLPTPPLPPRPAVLVTAPDLLLQQLPTPPAELGGETLTTQLRVGYGRFSAGAE